MNTKFILPGSLALTFHAFLLFGLPGKPPPAVIERETKPPVPTDAIKIDQDDPPPAPTNGEEKELSGRQSGTEVPSLPDIPADNYRYDQITMPVRPSVKVNHSGSIIPPDWQPGGGPRNPLGDVPDSVRLDRVPRARSQPAPIYPAGLRKDGIEGRVEVEFVVDMEGNVHNPVVLRASHPGFIESVLQAVARWKFEPGRIAGRIVRFRMSVPLVFAIEGR
jgi:protein TonB